MATRTIKRAAGKSDLTDAAVRTVVRNAVAGQNAAVVVVAGQTGEFSAKSRNAAAGAQKASGQGAAGAGRRKH